MPPQGPRKLAITFGTTSLTHYGGVYLLHRFFGRLLLRKLLTKQARLLQRNNRYTAGEMLLGLLYPMILGLERIETVQLLRQNGVFQHLTGLPSDPEAATLRRFRLRLAPGGLARLRVLHDRLLHRITVNPQPPSRLIFDVDSTVLVVYGKQEQGRNGNNPIKRGRPSYHPLLCFEGQSKDFWHGELRAGEAHTASGTLDLLQACLAKVQTGVQLVIVRADKGFYDHTLIEWLEARRARLAIVARLTAPIKRKLAHLRYTSPSRGIEVAEFRYQPTRWPHPYRFVVVRRPQPDEPTKPVDAFHTRQVPLPGAGHESAVAAAQPLALLQRPGWRRVAPRATQRGLRSGSIPTRHFLANETYFHLLLLAYNLVNWFERLCLPPDFQSPTLQTLRHKVLLMSAQLRRVKNRPGVNLPASGPREAAWRYALQKIEKLNV